MNVCRRPNYAHNIGEAGSKVEILSGSEAVLGQLVSFGCDDSRLVSKNFQVVDQVFLIND